MKNTLKILLTAILSITLTIFMSSSYGITKGETDNVFGIETVRVRSYGTDNSVMYDIVRPGTKSEQSETSNYLDVNDPEIEEIFYLMDKETEEIEPVEVVEESTEKVDITSIVDTPITYTYTNMAASSPIVEDDLICFHTIKKGDSWYEISRKYYGTGERSKALETYNNIKNFWPGVEIKIPSLENKEFVDLCNNMKELSRQKALDFQESMKGKTIKAGKNEKSVPYGSRYNPAVDITVPSTDNMKNGVKLDTSNLIYYGECFVTGYAPTCIECCESPEGICATGVYAIPGYTVAMSDAVPYGTTIYIEWSDGTSGAYVKEDTGALKDKTVDIACPYDEACGPVTEHGAKVWIVPN